MMEVPGCGPHCRSFLRPPLNQSPIEPQPPPIIPLQPPAQGGSPVSILSDRVKSPARKVDVTGFVRYCQPIKPVVSSNKLQSADVELELPRAPIWMAPAQPNKVKSVARVDDSIFTIDGYLYAAVLQCREVQPRLE